MALRKADLANITCEEDLEHAKEAAKRRRKRAGLSRAAASRAVSAARFHVGGTS